MIGINGVWGLLQEMYEVADITPVKSQFDEIARRRNLIVHEGDLVRHERGGKPRLNPHLEEVRPRLPGFHRWSCWLRPLQPVDATVLASVTAGVRYPSVLRGRVLSRRAISSSWAWV